MSIPDHSEPPVFAPESDNAGEWIKWGGGERPVSKDTWVFVKYQDGGTEGPDPAQCFDLNHVYETGNIIAYRLSAGGEAVHEQVSQPIRDEPKPSQTKAPSREQVAIPREMTDDMAEAICRVVNVCGGIAETIYSAIVAEQDRVTLFKGGEQ